MKFRQIDGYFLKRRQLLLYLKRLSLKLKYPLLIARDATGMRFCVEERSRYPTYRNAFPTFARES